MNDIKIFEDNRFGSIRTLERGGEPWFVAADVCRALELDKTWNALQRLDADEKGATSISTLGGMQTMNIINEAGLYTLVLSSRKPEAKAFRRWITHDVIPVIRQHGAYMTPTKIEEVLCNPDTIIRLASDLKAEQEARRAAERKIAADAPKVLFADAVASSKTSVLVGELAKVLRQNGVDIGQKRLFDWLRRHGWLISDPRRSDYNSPTQRGVERGYFEIKETAITHSDGTTHLTRTTKVTGKGQIYFTKVFLQEVEG